MRWSFPTVAAADTAASTTIPTATTAYDPSYLVIDPHTSIPVRMATPPLLPPGLGLTWRRTSYRCVYLHRRSSPPVVRAAHRRRRNLPHITLASQNVQGNSEAKREEALQWMRDADLFAYCQQETWETGSENLQNDGYLFIRHNAPTALQGTRGRGVRGLTIVLSPTAVQAWKAAGQQVFRFGPLGNERVMAIVVNADRGHGTVSVCIINGYAPDSSYSATAYKAFLSQLSQAVRAGRHCDVTLIAADVNDTLGTRQTNEDTICGPFGVLPATKRADKLRDFLGMRCLCSAASFFKSSQYATWWHPATMAAFQPDHWLLPRGQLGRVVVAKATAAGLSSDHTAVLLKLRVARSLRRRRSAMTAPGGARLVVDRTTVAEPYQRDAFAVAYAHAARLAQRELGPSPPQPRHHTSPTSLADPVDTSAPSPPPPPPPPWSASPPHVLPWDTLEIFTDGGCPLIAGWGVVLPAAVSSEIIALTMGGPVESSAWAVDKINNHTAELVGVCKALLLLLLLPGSQPALLRTDNLSAGKQAVGWWTGSSDQDLIAFAQLLAAKVRHRRQLWWRHVYSHGRNTSQRDNVLNDEADFCATMALRSKQYAIYPAHLQLCISQLWPQLAETWDAFFARVAATENANCYHLSTLIAAQPDDHESAAVVAIIPSPAPPQPTRALLPATRHLHHMAQLTITPLSATSLSCLLTLQPSPSPPPPPPSPQPPLSLSRLEDLHRIAIIYGRTFQRDLPLPSPPPPQPLPPLQPRGSFRRLPQFSPSVRTSEVDRILRARHEFGVLFLEVTPTAIGPTSIHAAYDACLFALDSCRRHPRFHVAIATAWSSFTTLLDMEMQAKTRAAWRADVATTPSRLRPVTKVLTCPIDVRALTAFAASDGGLRHPINKKGERYGGSYRFLISRLIRHVSTADHHGVGLLTIQYRHSELGAVMMDCGVIVASREYAIGAAPIKWPKRIRALALARFGAESDDSKCHPRGLAAIVDPVADLVGFFVRYNKPIITHLAEAALCRHNHHLSLDAAKALLKPLFNALHMDGSVRDWIHRLSLLQPPVHAHQPTLALSFEVGGRSFNLYDYAAAQTTGTQWLAGSWQGRAISLVSAHQLRTKGQSRHPERTLKSYYLQEPEGISRQAKCIRHEDLGCPVIDQWHDGTPFAADWPGRSDGVIQLDSMTAVLTAACSAALGYNQPVELKFMDVEAGRDLPPSPSPRASPTPLPPAVPPPTSIDCGVPPMPGAPGPDSGGGCDIGAGASPEATATFTSSFSAAQSDPAATTPCITTVTTTPVRLGDMSRRDSFCFTTAVAPSIGSFNAALAAASAVAPIVTISAVAATAAATNAAPAAATTAVDAAATSTTTPAVAAAATPPAAPRTAGSPAAAITCTTTTGRAMQPGL